MTARPASLVVAVSDPTRPDAGAVALAELLVAGTAIAIDVVTLPRDGDRRELLADRVAGRDGDVVVVDVYGGGFAGDRLLDEDAELVLERAAMPTLARGPGAPQPVRPRTLVVAVDGSADVAAALVVASTWRVSFGAPAVIVAMLQAPSGWPDTTAPVDERLARALREHDLDSATVEVVAATEPADDLAAFVARHVDPVLLVVARRWPGHDHWFSTARRLIRRAGCPVLVVPVAR